MSVVGRLWRRAPAWRFCLVSALACTGLAAMFPPSLPAHWPSLGRGGAHYASRTASPPPSGTELYAPAEAPTRQGLTHLAGRLLPLPAGTWRELAIMRGGESDVPQTDMFYRVSGAAGDPSLTGLIFATGPGPATGAVGPAELPLPCRDVGLWPGEIVPTLPSQSPLAHECWVLSEVATAHVEEQSLLHLALARLAERHVAVPPQMVRIDFVRSDDTGWMNVLVLMPGGRGRLKPLEAWAARFARLLHRGYDRTLVEADLTPAAIDDPR